MFAIQMPKEEGETTYYIYNANEYLITIPKSYGIIPKQTYYGFDIKDGTVIFYNTTPIIINPEKIIEFQTNLKSGKSSDIPYGHELTEEEYNLLEQYNVQQAKDGTIDSELFDEEQKVRQDIAKIKTLKQ